MISPVALAYEELAKGSKGDAVVELQERLNELGYSVGTADGDFGGKTESAVKQYQTDNGIEATGIVDDTTFNYIFGINGIIEACTLDEETIYELQANLKTLGYIVSEPTGKYDYDTIEAVRYFQSANELEITGIADDAAVGTILAKCSQQSSYLHPFMTGTKYGFIDTDGNIIIPAIAQSREDDTIITMEVSRLSRSTQQLCEIINIIKQKRLRLMILCSITVDCRSGSIDPMSQAFVQMSAVFAELELSIIRARVKSGMANAKAKGKQIGRPQTTKDDIPSVFFKHYPAYVAGKMNISEFARVCDLSRTTVYKYIDILDQKKE